MPSLVQIGNMLLIPYKHRPGEMFTVVVGEFARESQVFSYQRRHDDGSPEGDMIHVAVWPLRQYLRKNMRGDVRLYVVTPEQAAFVVRNNGIEMDHLDRMSRADADEPGIILLWADGQETIINGNHRFVKRWQLGLPEMWFFVITEEQVKPFLLDFPDELAPQEAQEARARS